MRASVPLILASTLVACVRAPSPPSTPVQEDPSITFPQFFDKEALTVGTEGKSYELDGEMLRALTIAINDFLPSESHETPCWRRREAQLYRVIRQQNIIFIYIHENHVHCGRAYPALDSGAKYAISSDGRILRRLLDGQEGGPFDRVREPGDAGFIAEPGTSPTFDALWNSPASPTTRDVQDGGVGSSRPQPPATLLTVSDGGAAAAP